MKISVAKRAKQRKTIPHIKIRDNLSSRMKLALKEQNLTKRNTTAELTGCSIKFLKQYLERKFKPGMTWKNHGRFGWHIDHIRPCSKFDLSNHLQQKICFNYQNLQPLWAKENILKSNKLFFKTLLYEDIYTFFIFFFEKSVSSRRSSFKGRAQIIPQPLRRMTEDRYWPSNSVINANHCS